VALPEVAAAFTQATGQRAELTFGASGLLLRQLTEGAPFDVFVSADEGMVDTAIDRGACARDTKALYATGELSLWWRSDLALAPPAGLGDLADARFRHVSIANPDSAPYGRAAREALVSAGVWDAVVSRLVYGENVRQALQFAQSGNADVAIVGRALASRSGGGSLPVDASLHAPLRQAVAACASGPNPDAGRAFAAFLAAPAAQSILRAHQFAPANGR
jgi:molybdate transport system substrate-binding protein